MTELERMLYARDRCEEMAAAFGIRASVEIVNRRSTQAGMMARDAASWALMVPLYDRIEASIAEEEERDV